MKRTKHLVCRVQCSEHRDYSNSILLPVGTSRTVCHVRLSKVQSPAKLGNLVLFSVSLWPRIRDSEAKQRA